MYCSQGKAWCYIPVIPAGGRNQKDHGSRPAWAKLQDYQKKIIKTKIDWKHD
jgi:hypothetical protein